MMKWKWVGWIGKMAITAAIIAGLSVFTTWYTVNQYIQQILKQFHLENIQSEFKISDFVSHLSDIGNILQLNNHSTLADSQNRQQVGMPADSLQATPVPETSLPADAKPEQEDSGLDGSEALPVFGQQHMSEEESRGILISADELYRKKEEISNEDKMNIFSILVAKLPQEELQKMSEEFEDGLTAAELEQMKQVIATYLQQNEMERLAAILNKY